MDLRVLGPVELVGSQGRVALGGPQRRLLLALLAARAGEVVSAGALADALWGDEPPPAATVVLQSQLSRLRKLVEPSRAARAPATVIRSVGDGYLLDLAGHGFDAREFGALLSRSRKEPPERAAAGLTEALALWRGPAYGDLAGHRALADAAAELDELRLTARELWADAELDRGEHRQLVGELESLVRDHPFRERFTAQLMLALYRSGRQADALATYQRSRRQLVRELGIEPGPELRTLDQQILLQSPELDHRYAARPAPVVLPGPRTSFVGRETELAGIREALGRRQLVTIAGPGGVGKTRLALEVAAAVAPGLRHGAARCDLAAVPPSAGTALEDAVAAAVGHRTPAADGQDLAGYLAGQELLLVLDNADHLVPATAALAGRLLSGCPQLRLLVTSREPLGVSGEQLVRLAPLPVDGAAVRLFLDRAVLSAPGVELDPEAVAQVCRRLDGLPLALELAASRLRSVPLEHVVAGLDALSSAPLPAGGTHGTLREVIGWTVDLLDASSRALLRRLSVFSGGFTAPAAARVCGIEGDPVEALAVLVDRSLVQLDPRERRYRLLETIRSDGLSRLDAAGETATYRARHLGWCLGLAAEPETADVEDPDRFRALAAELPNVTAALATADDVQAGAMLAVAAAPCWIHAGRFGEARRWLEQAVAATDDGGRVQRLARWRLGWVLARQHDLAAARLALTAALGDPAYTDELALETEILLAQVEVESGDLATGQARLSKQLASPEVQRSVRRRAAVTLGLGRRALLAGELPEATELLDEATDAAREARAWDTLVHALAGLVQAESGRGNLDRAGGAVAEALTVARRRRLLGAMPTLLGSAATVAYRSDDRELAVARFTEALSAARQAGDLRAELATVNNLGVIALQGGRPLDAIEQFEQAIELADRVGDHRTAIMITANLSEAVLNGTHDVRRALRLARDALRLARSADVPVAAMFALESAAYALVERGTPDDLGLAGRLLGGVAAGHEAVGRRSDAADQVAAALERIRAGLGAEEAGRVFAAGHAAGMDVVATDFLSD